MKRAFGLVGLILALGIGFWIYKVQYSSGPTGGAPPKQTIDVAGVKSDLLAIAQAERLYLAGHSSYATLEQLQQEGSLTFSGTSRRGYNYTADIDDGQHFKVTATPSDPAKAGWPTLTIDENMQVTQQ
jgi:hypothetical protein